MAIFVILSAAFTFFMWIASVVSFVMLAYFAITLLTNANIHEFWNLQNGWAWVVALIGVLVSFAVVKFITSRIWAILLTPIFAVIYAYGMKNKKGFLFISDVTMVFQVIFLVVGIILAAIATVYFIIWTESTGATDYFVSTNIIACIITFITMLNLVSGSNKKSA